MSRTGKAGIALALLIIPALIYLLVRTGTNHYVLPRYVPEIDSATGEPRMARVKGPDGNVVEDTVFRRILPFRLTDQNGNVATEALVKGKIHVADFIFTRCGTICPRLTTQLARVQDVLRQHEDLRFLSFTVDPSHDTPAVLKAYAERYNAQSGKWYFLTGDKAEIYRLAHQSYFISALEKPGKADPNETFTHSEKLVLVDKDGIIRGFYDGTDKEDVDRLIAEIRVLLDIYAKR